MIRAVIFDMDGLMLDTEQLSKEAWDQIGIDRGVGPFGHLIVHLIGRNRADNEAFFRERFGDRLTFDTILELKEQYFQKTFAEKGVPVKKGLFELLNWLKDQGIPAAVATSTEEATARAELAQAGILPYMDRLVFGNMVPHGKPAPDIFLLAAEQLGVSPECCMVLEDSPSGIRAAHAAGMVPVMVPDLVQPDEALRALLHTQVESLDQVPALIAELNR